MKNAFKLAFVGLAMAFVGCLGFRNTANTVIIDKNMADDPLISEIASSETEIPSESQDIQSVSVDSTEEKAECTVVLAKTEHGTFITDVNEGKIGDICTVTAKHDMLYKVKTVTANGTALIEDETTSGVYRFALVAGENVVTVRFCVDEDLCKELTTIVEQVGNEDWDNLFTIENAINVINWLLNGGMVIAIVRYAIKDKKTAEKTEKAINDTIEKVVTPEIKEKITAAFSTVIEPMFKQTLENDASTMRAMKVFAKCMALSQDSSPDARKAVLDELMTLNVSDESTIKDVKEYIDQQIEAQRKSFEETMRMVSDIKKDAGVVETEAKAEAEEPSYDGTSI